MNANSWLKKAKLLIPPLDAELILKHVLNFDDRSDLILYSDRILTPAELSCADKMLTSRQNHIPLAYLLGHKFFYSRPFTVTPATLIPRPETEDIVSMILDNQHQESSRRLHILDIGTGSGCLGITLALELPNAQITALDISEAALKIAKQNARELNTKNIHFQKSDLLKDYFGPRPDIIVANLPYVDRGWNWTSPEIEHEPPLALFADHHGLALIYRLLDEIKQKWYNSRYDYPLHLYLEADPCQHSEIIKYAESLGFRHISTLNFILELTFSAPDTLGV